MYSIFNDVQFNINNMDGFDLYEKLCMCVNNACVHRESMQTKDPIHTEPRYIHTTFITF